MNITIKYQYGGRFEVIKDRLLYKKALTFTKINMDVNLISKFELESILKEEGNVANVKELWYLEPGKNLANGLKQVIMDQDVRDMVKNAEMGGVAHVYVVENNDPSPSSLMLKMNTNVVEGRITSQQAIGSSAEVQPRCFHQARISSQNTSVHHQIRGYSDELQYEKEGIVLGSDSSTSDSDFSFADSEEEDEDIFKEYVDQTVLDDVRRLVTADDDVNYAEEPELDDGSDELKSGSGTEEGSNTRYPEFNPLVDFRKRITLITGMIFGSNDIFRRALRQHSIENGGEFYYLHNDNYKVSTYCKYKCDCSIKHSRKKCVCKKILCGFKACARRMRPDGSFQLKSFNFEHNCGWQHVNEKATSAWLAEQYIEHYRDDPHWKITSFINTFQRDHKVSISYSQAWRARLRAYLMTQGDAKVQYGKVWDYAATLIKYNPGSSAYVKVYLDQPERPLFQRLYVCLDACKRGFLRGCRPIIGLDGCHLKGAYTGQILAAVAKDGNENIFHVAYAVVEAERKETWGWFIENLLQDIGGSVLTFMSDRQKGLIEALAHVAPMCDTRVCVRHLYNNFKVKWPGKGFKDALWAAARASTKFDFEEAMDYIKTLDEKAYSYLIKADPSTWSRHGFKHTTKSDMQLNNICESFNSYILQARDKPILTMCEWIRRQLMKQIVSKHEGMSKYVGSLTPKAEKRLQYSKDESLQRCRAYWGGGDRFKVEHFDRIFVVDLMEKSCGCMKWDLTRIPCPHAIACIMMRRLKLEDFVHRYYSRETYLKAYEHMIQPMPGEVD